MGRGYCPPLVGAKRGLSRSRLSRSVKLRLIPLQNSSSMAFQSLRQALTSIEQQPAWQTRWQFQRVLDCWPTVVGGVVAAQTRPVAIQRRVLQVATSSPVWAQNLLFERHRILAKLNPQLPEPLTDIRFSTAQWRVSGQPSTAERSPQPWREHPSYVPALPDDIRREQPSATTPEGAFQNWARVVRARSQHLPKCPQCHCPTPPGELERWAVCGLCIVQQWRS